MDVIKIVKSENSLLIASPYNAGFASRLKELSGFWNKSNRTWKIPVWKEDEVLSAVKESFPDAEIIQTEQQPYMSIEKKIRSIVAKPNIMSDDSMERLVAMAYWIGREEATKNVCDRYRKKIEDMRESAKQSRYSNLIMQIIGQGSFVYNEDYYGHKTKEIGQLETKL